jgi:hypothetical protein
MEPPETRELPPPDDDESPWQATVEWWLVGFLLYGLSIGPMYWHWFLGKYTECGPIWIAMFYEPLWLLARWIPPLGWCLDSYIRWWII